MPVHNICVSPLDGKQLLGEEQVRNNVRAEAKMFHGSTPTFIPMERCSSLASTTSTGHDICRICHCEGDSEVPLIAPCYCAGSLRYVHQACLQQWIKSSDIKSCELCKFQFVMQTKIKPFRNWEKLDMSAVEKRKVVCSVSFHLLAITCVVWSLYVLIDRTADEIRVGVLMEWPFWTKIIVVAIGFTGGLVFMYIQCKMYVLLCQRWRAFNRIIYVQNVPEKLPPPPSSGHNGNSVTPAHTPPIPAPFGLPEPLPPVALGPPPQLPSIPPPSLHLPFAPFDKARSGGGGGGELEFIKVVPNSDTVTSTPDSSSTDTVLPVESSAI